MTLYSNLSVPKNFTQGFQFKPGFEEDIDLYNLEDEQSQNVECSRDGAGGGVGGAGATTTSSSQSILPQPTAVAPTPQLKETYSIKYQYKKHFMCTQARVLNILQLIFSCTLISDLDDESNTGNLGNQASDLTVKPDREYFTVTITPFNQPGAVAKSYENVLSNLRKAKTFVRNNYHEGPFYERTFAFLSDSLIGYCLNGLIWRYALDITLESEMKVYIRSASNRDRQEEGKADYDACKQCLVKFLQMEREKKHNYDPLYKNGLGETDTSELQENIAKFLPSRRHEQYNSILKLFGVDSYFFVPGLRHIILDVSNIAMVHGQEKFSWLGVRIAYDHFRDLGHDQLTLIVPHFRRHKTTSPSELAIIEEFERLDVLKYTQSRIPTSSTHDDRFMLQLAHRVGAVIVSNDKFSDLARENPAWKELTRDFVCTFIFVKDVFLLALDPQGREGDRLPRVLRKFDSMELCCATAAMYCKFGELCNYGKKCKYMHRTVKENRRSRTKRNPSGTSSGSQTPLMCNSINLHAEDAEAYNRFRSQREPLSGSNFGQTNYHTNMEAFNQNQVVSSANLNPHYAHRPAAGLLPPTCVQNTVNGLSTFPLEHNSDFSDAGSLSSSNRHGGSIMSLYSTTSSLQSASQHSDNASMLSNGSFVLTSTIYENPVDNMQTSFDDYSSYDGNSTVTDASSISGSSVSSMSMYPPYASNMAAMHSMAQRQQQQLHNSAMLSQFMPQQAAQLALNQLNVNARTATTAQDLAINAQMENLNVGFNSQNQPSSGNQGSVQFPTQSPTNVMQGSTTDANIGAVSLNISTPYQGKMEADDVHKVSSPTSGTSPPVSSSNLDAGASETSSSRVARTMVGGNMTSTTWTEGYPSPEKESAESKKYVAPSTPQPKSSSQVEGSGFSTTLLSTNSTSITCSSDNNSSSGTAVQASTSGNLQFSNNEINTMLRNNQKLQTAAHNLSLVAQLFPLALCLLVTQLQKGLILERQKFCMAVCNFMEKEMTTHSLDELNVEEFWMSHLNEPSKFVLSTVRLLKQSGSSMVSILMMFPEVLSTESDANASSQTLTAEIVRQRIRQFMRC